MQRQPGYRDVGLFQPEHAEAYQHLQFAADVVAHTFEVAVPLILGAILDIDEGDRQARMDERQGNALAHPAGTDHADLGQRGVHQL
ncbi:hypothetical protein D3C84_925740 [compost metagenome]